MGFGEVPGGRLFYWPATPDVVEGLTPREAWQALLAGEIDGDTFGRVLRVWDEAWIRVEV